MYVTSGLREDPDVRGNATALIAGQTGLKAGDSNAIALLGAPRSTGANIPGESVDNLQYPRQLFALNSHQAWPNSMRFRRTRVVFRPARLHAGYSTVQSFRRLLQQRPLLRIDSCEPVVASFATTGALGRHTARCRKCKSRRHDKAARSRSARPACSATEFVARVPGSSFSQRQIRRR